MAIWAQIDVTLHLDVFHAVALDSAGWYRIAVRVYKDLGNKRIAALPLNSGTSYLLEGVKDVLPTAFQPHVNVEFDDDTYMSKLFFTKDRNCKVEVNELARFVAELPALPSVLHSSAFFVEVQLIICRKMVENEQESDESDECERPVEILDTKVFRVSNLAFCNMDYYVCNLERDHTNGVLHIALYTNVIKFCFSRGINQPLTRSPCEKYFYWKRHLKVSRNKEVSSWFVRSNEFENIFYDHINPFWLFSRSRTSIVSCLHVGEASPDNPLCWNNTMKIVREFISQVTQGIHACDSLFGRHDDDLHAVSLDLVQKKSQEMEDEVYIQGARMLMYVYAKIIAYNAISLATLWREPAEQSNIDTNNKGVDDIPSTSVFKFWKDMKTELILPPPPAGALCKNGAILTLTGGKFKEVIDYEEVSEPLFTTYSPYIPHEMLCRRLNAISDILGIKKLAGDRIAISLPNDIMVVVDDCNPTELGLSGLDYIFSSAMNRMLSGMSSWVYLKWGDYISRIVSTKRDESCTRIFSEEQAAFFNLLGNPNIDEVDLVRMLRSLTITDEHHFFLADCFPLYKHVRGNFQERKYMVGKKEPLKTHLIVIVHGYQSFPMAMNYFRNTIMAFAENVNVMVACSLFEDPEAPIDEKCKSLAKEIEMYVQRNIHMDKLGKLSFITYSMGGLVTRGALKYMEKYHDKLYAMLSLYSPHIGVPYMKFKVLEAGTKMFASYRDSSCLKEMTLSDNTDIKQCYLYKLSKEDVISKFKVIKLVGILQDYISQAYSCLLDLSLTKSTNKLVEEMVDNISSRISAAQVDRYYVDYSGASKYIWWKATGAHIHILNCAIVARVFILMTYDIFNVY